MTTTKARPLSAPNVSRILRAAGIATVPAAYRGHGIRVSRDVLGAVRVEITADLRRHELTLAVDVAVALEAAGLLVEHHADDAAILYVTRPATPVVTTRNGARVPANAAGKPIIRWYCTTDRSGAVVHVDACGDVVNGPSRIVHAGGRIECEATR